MIVFQYCNCHTILRLFAQLQALIMQYFLQNDWIDWIEKHRIAVFLLEAQITTFVLEHYCSTCYTSAIYISPNIFYLSM